MATFGVSARTMLHLGAELITSDAIALYELIKNSIDAKSKEIDVWFDLPIDYVELNKIQTKWASQSPRRWDDSKEDDVDYLRKIVRDDINENQRKRINKIFKKILLSKSKVDAIRESYSINRILVSDKGTGMSKGTLEDAFLTVGTPYKLTTSSEEDPLLGNKGIGRLAMMRLGKKAYVRTWNGGKNYHRIIFDWTKFESPSKKISDITFNVSSYKSDDANTTGTKIDIVNLTRDWTLEEVKKDFIEKFLRRLRNPFNINESNFQLNVKYNNSDRLPIKKLSPELVGLTQRKLHFDLNSSGSDKPGLVLEIFDPKRPDEKSLYETSLLNLSHALDCTIDDIDKIGNVSFDLLWFNRKTLKNDIKNIGLSKNSKDLIKELDVWSGGVAIYRDGFRIGLSGSQDDKDWLELDRQALRGQGFTVNRIQIISALSISKNKNVNLIDRSNREGLIENAEVKLLSEIIKSVALQELKSNINKSKDIEVKDQLNDIIENGAEQASNKLDSIRRSVTKLNDGATTQQKKLISLINEDLHFIANQVKNFESVASNLIEQREDIIELAGAGNMMHGVLHELARTTEQTKELVRKLSKKADNETAAILEKLEREIKTINVRVRQFNPLAPNARNRKEKVDIVVAIKTVLTGYENRFGRHDINANLLMNGFSDLEPFVVNMVPGFLYITIENLIMNSVYWLKQDGIFSKMPGTVGRNIDIDIDTKARSILIQDNGPGIAVSDKERVFDAGFSTKSSRKDGKGFGLFLAREIIRFHGGNLYLLPTPDSDNRLRTFVIELPDENK